MEIDRCVGEPNDRLMLSRRRFCIPTSQDVDVVESGGLFRDWKDSSLAGDSVSFIMVDGEFTFRSAGQVARPTRSEPVTGAIASLANPRDWADAAAMMDVAIRIFAEAIRPVVQNGPASRLATSNILLLMLMDGLGPVKVADIIREGHLIPSNATYALKALHGAGCIEHDTDPNDRRTKVVVLTPFGRDIVAAVRQRCRPERGTEWIRACQNVVRNFEAAFAPPAKTKKPLAQPAAKASAPPKPLRGRVAPVPSVLAPLPAAAPHSQATVVAGGAPVSGPLASTRPAGRRRDEMPDMFELLGEPLPPSTTK